MFFESWSGLGRVLVVGVAAYVALVVILRISGKRTLSKMSAFDLVVTVALGSTLATVFLSKDVPVAEGVLAFALLASMQYVIAWTSVRSATVRRLVRSEPALLLRRGEFLRDAMRTERVTEAEVLAAIRAQGIGRVEAVEAVVLETDGTITVLSQQNGGPASSLEGVKRVGEGAG